MMHFLKFFIVMMTLMFSQQSLAVQCTSSGIVSGAAIINSPVNVAPTAPAGTIVWEGPPQHVVLQCKQKLGVNTRESIAVFLGQHYRFNTADIGEKLEPGIRVGGSDFLCSNSSFLGSCGRQTGQFVDPCPTAQNCPITRFTYVFTPLLAVKTQGHVVNQGGSLVTNTAPYPIVQFAGTTTTNTTNHNNYTLFVHGLGNINYAGCYSTIDVHPRTIEFQPVQASTASAGQTISDERFSMTATKSCNSPYGINVRLLPLSDSSLTDSNHTLVPNNNQSVGIQIFDYVTKQRLPFRAFFTVAPEGNTNQLVTKELLARLVWMKNTADIGPFKASVEFTVMYL